MLERPGKNHTVIHLSILPTLFSGVFVCLGASSSPLEPRPTSKVPMVPLGPAMIPVQLPRVMVTIANDKDILGGREIAFYSSEQFFPW